MIDRLPPRRFWLIAVVCGSLLALCCWLTLIVTSTVFHIHW